MCGRSTGPPLLPVRVVAARLGHADPVITLRVHAHLIRFAESAVVEIFTQALDQGSGP
ncbi:hypothetical protein ACFQSB_08070 [Sphaerisporangium rhizosphaerae]|uniref:Integrase n=2 Tax=Sphaerisporangium rhizosphaerae TaxID=2269375 RepID=A0ABW2P0Y4_9ACTN